MYYRALAFIALLLCISSPAWAATTRYVATTGSDANSCAASATITTPKLTFASAVACMSAGDTLYIRSGTYTEQINLQQPTVKTGTAGNYLTIAGYPGDTKPIIRVTESATDLYGAIKMRGSIAYVIIDGLVLDGNVNTNRSGWQIRDGNHDIIVQNMEIKNFAYNGIYIDGDNITVRNNSFHDMRSVCACSGERWYGIYFHSGLNGLITNNNVYNNPGGGIQAYTGNMPNLQVLGNYIHDNNTIAASDVFGGILFGNGAGTNSNNSVLAHNLIINNGSAAGANKANSHGVLLYGGVDGTKIYHNTIYGNTGAGIVVQPTSDATIITNNHVIGNTGGQISNNGTNTVQTTNRITGTITDCTVSTSDFRQKSGSSCVAAGTAITGFAANGTPDIGAYESFTYSSATINGSNLDLTLGMSLNTPVTASGVTGITVGCTGSGCGTPVAGTASRLTGSDSVLRVPITGITTGVCAAGQTWTVTCTACTAADSANIGGPYNSQANQTVTPFTTQAVTNACGVAIPTPPAAGLQFFWKLDDNTGTSANDETVNNVDGTLTGTPTPQWVAGKSGFAVHFTDQVDTSITSTYGSGINPSTQSLSVCGWFKADTGLGSSQRIVWSSTFGTNQRFYAGWVAGTWGIGIQSSGFASNPEFPVVDNTWTHLCVVANSGTDTATLYVNGVKGLSSQSVKTYTSFTLAANIHAGGDNGFTINEGGSTADHFKVWNVVLTDQEVLDDFNSIEPAPPTPIGTFNQVAHQFDDIFIAGGHLAAVNASISLRANTAFSLVLQTDCTVADCVAIGQRLQVSRNGGLYANVQDVCATDTMCFYGPSADPLVFGVTNGTVTCCLSGVLTAQNGLTQFTSSAIPIFDLPQNGSVTQRYNLKSGTAMVTNDTFDFRLVNQDGSLFATDPPSHQARVTITSISGIAAPASLRAVGAASNTIIELVWQAVNDATLVGYEVCQSLVSGTYTSCFTPITFSTASATQSSMTSWRTVVDAAGTYYFIVKAIDNLGNRSVASNEVIVVRTGFTSRITRVP